MIMGEIHMIPLKINNYNMTFFLNKRTNLLKKVVFGIFVLIGLNTQAQSILKARINQYDPELHNEKVAFKESALVPGEQFILLGESKWQIELSQNEHVQGDQEIQVIFRCVEGQISNASVSLEMGIDDWSLDNYLLMPAAVYNGNRYPAVVSDYMPFWNDPSQLGVDKPIMLSNQPRLNYNDGASKIQLRSGSMSIPSVGIQNPETKLGTWVFFNQGNEQGDYGVTFTENKSRNQAVLSLVSPVVREKTQYYIANNDAPSEDILANFVKGDVISFNLKMVQFGANNRQDLFNKWIDYRKDYHPKDIKITDCSLSNAFKTVEEKFNRQNWRDLGYYAVGTTDNFFQDWQIGWTGGMITTLPLLLEGKQISKERVIKNFDWLYEKGVAPTGYYYDVVFKNKPSGAFPLKALGDSLLLTRKNADATYYIYKQFMALNELGIPVKEKWEIGNENALKAQINTWKKYGQLGQFVNQETGRLVIGNTTSSGIFPASLCAAYNYTGNKAYIAYAEEIGEYFYKNFIQKGLVCGGPGDAMQSFDSESSYALLVSMVDLYETTKNEKWLQRSIEMANQFSTWVVGYDYKFPEGSLYHKLGMRSTGGVYANTQNQHAGPGICTHSGEALLKLYRFTNNQFYLDLCADIVHSLPQFLSRSESPIKCLEDGWVSERINMTDWLEGIGETMCGSTWAETALLLAATELPGVYIEKDNGNVTVFDQVNAEVIKNTSNQIWVKISNPTSEVASLKIFAESNLDRKNAYGYNPNMNWDRIILNPGEKKVLKLKKRH
jgi:hypothetical protein